MSLSEKDDAHRLGHFLEYRHWRQALELLEYQLDRKKTNRHFNRLEMFYYEKLEDSFEILEGEGYFETRIANNRFYGLSKEFWVVAYTVPKSNLGLRQYKFMTCPMRVLYYAIGIYLLELAQDYLENYKSYKRIQAKFGGHLNFDNGKLNLKPNSVYYKPHYRHFRTLVGTEIKTNTERKTVIYLDIQNYFDELSVPKLLDLLKERVKPSIQRKMHYDEITQDQLVSFFDFAVGGALGILQSDNNIISDFLGHLYLVFGDLLLDDELLKNNDSVENHAIYRYVDDIYIAITFKEEKSNSREEFLNSLAPRISDCFYKDLGLRLNPKTRLFNLNVETDRKDLASNLKKVSHGEAIDEKNHQPPREKIENIFKQLRILKNSRIDPYFQGHRELDGEVLKAVYEDDVQQMLEIPVYKRRLKDIFMDSGGFDFELVNADPMPIIILILKCDDVPEEFERFLLSKSQLTSRDISLTLSYLCQNGFAQNGLLDLLKGSPEMKKIMEIFDGEGLSSELLGYFDLTEEQTLKITQPYVIEQIRLRILCEQRGEYSVALNHLRNEIEVICGELNEKTKGTSNYGEKTVTEFLRNQKVPNNTCTQIQNLFDRRNKSPVPHADPIAWAVTKDEYETYRTHVGKCLKHIL